MCLEFSRERSLDFLVRRSVLHQLVLPSPSQVQSRARAVVKRPCTLVVVRHMVWPPGDVTCPPALTVWLEVQLWVGGKFSSSLHFISALAVNQGS